MLVGIVEVSVCHDTEMEVHMASQSIKIEPGDTQVSIVFGSALENVEQKRFLGLVSLFCRANQDPTRIQGISNGEPREIQRGFNGDFGKPGGCILACPRGTSG